MELAFETKILRSICESNILAAQYFDAFIVKSLLTRLADLRAVDKIFDLPLGNPTHILYEDKDCINIKLPNNEYIILSANHIKPPLLENGDLDWSLIYRVKIMCIGSLL